MIFSATDALIGGVQVLFGHQKQRSPPLGFSLPWALKWLFMGCSTLLENHSQTSLCLREGGHSLVGCSSFLK
jgi:hypothetical protein